jgi:hypothetical protein
VEAKSYTCIIGLLVTPSQILQDMVRVGLFVFLVGAGGSCFSVLAFIMVVMMFFFPCDLDY